MADPFEHPVNVRYLEVDRQGVVFNAWYLAYFDDALTAWQAHMGFPYTEMMAAGFDLQLVHSEIDWTGSLGFGDQAAVAVEVTDVGRTSFTLSFTVRRDGQPVAAARTVYVCVGTDGNGKRPIPDRLLAALTA